MQILPEFNKPVIQRNVGGGHRYYVEGFPCGTCAKCGKGQKCIGLPSVTKFSGSFGSFGVPYNAGMRHALDIVFGAYTDKTKSGVDPNSWLNDWLDTVDFAGDNRINALGLLPLRQEVESTPTPGDISRDFGNGVHAALESVLAQDGREIEIPIQYSDAVDAVLKWLAAGDSDGPYKVEATELPIFHPELLYAGTIDCVFRTAAGLAVVDWKSGGGIYESHAMQIAAYAMALELMTGEAITQAWVVRSGKRGFEAKRVADLQPAQRAFIAMIEASTNIGQIEWQGE